MKYIERHVIKTSAKYTMLLNFEMFKNSEKSDANKKSCNLCKTQGRLKILRYISVRKNTVLYT